MSHGKARPAPLVTVGVPVFNGERYLSDCLDSLLGQDFEDFSLIISDNASTDGTEDISREYEKRDSRIRYVRNPKNIGMYGNITALFRLADTKYFKLANADDFWAPTMLRKSVDLLERDTSVVLCYPHTILVDKNRRVTQRYGKELHLLESEPVRRFKRVLSELRLVNQLQGVIRSAVLRRVLPLRDHTFSDRVLLAELSLYGRIYQLPDYLYFRRFHEDSSSFARASESHQIRHVYPEGTRNIRWESWRYHLGLIKRVLLSRLSPREQSDLLAFLMRNMFWERGALMGELSRWGRGS